MRTKRLGLRSISFLLAFTMVLSDVLYAAPIESWAPAVSAKEALLHDPLRFEAPLDFSLLKDVRRGEKKTFIIHIQDAHSNLSGQQNLAGALDDLMKRYDVSLVLVEGGTRDDSLTPLKKLASPEVWKRVAKKFLIAGTLSGEEYLNLTSDRPMKIMGIEDKELYWESLRAYEKLASKREDILLQSKKLQNNLAKLKKKLYPQELWDYEKLGAGSWELGEIHFEERFEKLLSLRGAQRRSNQTGKIASGTTSPRNDVLLKGFPNAQALLEIQNREGDIDFNAANLEQAALLEELAKRGGKEDVQAALKKISKLKGSRLSQLNLIESLLRTARERSVALEAYPNLALYEKYLHSFLSVDFEKLFDEVERLEDEVYRAVIASPGGAKQSDITDALLVRSIDRYLGLLDSAYRIQMSTKEFELFKLNEPDFATASYLAFVNRKLADLGYFDDLIPMQTVFEEAKSSLVEFYASVSRRDEAFMRNTERILAEEKQQVAVLIAGGYHSSNLKKLFSQNEYSYAVLAPIVTSETNQEKYESILLEPIRKKTVLVETASGESRADNKSLSALEEDLQSLKKKTDGLRDMRIAESAGSRLAALVEAAARPGDERIPEAVLEVTRGQGARLAKDDSSAASETMIPLDEWLKKNRNDVRDKDLYSSNGEKLNKDIQLVWVERAVFMAYRLKYPNELFPDDKKNLPDTKNLELREILIPKDAIVWIKRREESENPLRSGARLSMLADLGLSFSIDAVRSSYKDPGLRSDSRTAVVMDTSGDGLRVVLTEFTEKTSDRKNLLVFSENRLVAYASISMSDGQIRAPVLNVLEDKKGYMRRAVKLLLETGNINEWHSGFEMSPLALRMYEALGNDPTLRVEGSKESGFRVKMADPQGTRLAKTFEIDSSNEAVQGLGKEYDEILNLLSQDLTSMVGEGMATLTVTGLPGAGKSYFANGLKDYLSSRGISAVILDTDWLHRHVGTSRPFISKVAQVVLGMLPFISPKVFWDFISKSNLDPDEVHRVTSEIIDFAKTRPQSDKEFIELTIANHPIRLTNKSVLIVEGLYAKELFSGLPNQRSLWLDVKRSLARQSIRDRSSALSAKSFFWSLLESFALTPNKMRTFLSNQHHSFDYVLKVESRQKPSGEGDPRSRFFGLVFVQKRLGFRGVSFDIFKIMTLDSNGSYKLFGKILRETGLDEVLQLINVAMGQMTIFGQRPLLESELKHDLSIGNRYQKEVLSKEKPGLISLYVVRVGPGRANNYSQDTLTEALRYKLLFHRYELKHRSNSLNLKMLLILAETLFKRLLTGKYDYPTVDSLQKAPEIQALLHEDLEYVRSVMGDSFGARLAERTKLKRGELKQLRNTAITLFLGDLKQPLIEALPTKRSSMEIIEYLINALTDNYEELREEYVANGGRKAVAGKEEVREALRKALGEHVADKNDWGLFATVNRLFELDKVNDFVRHPLYLFESDADKEAVSRIAMKFGSAIAVVRARKKISRAKRISAMQRRMKEALAMLDIYGFWSEEDLAMGYFMLIRLVDPEDMAWAVPPVLERLRGSDDSVIPNERIVGLDDAAILTAARLLFKSKLDSWMTKNGNQDPLTVSDKEFEAMLPGMDHDLAFALKLSREIEWEIRDTNHVPPQQPLVLDLVLEKAKQLFDMARNEEDEMGEEIRPHGVATYAAKWVLRQYQHAHQNTSVEFSQNLPPSIAPQVGVFFVGRRDAEGALFALGGVYRVFTAFMALLRLFRKADNQERFHKQLVEHLNFHNVHTPEGIAKVMKHMDEVIDLIQDEIQDSNADRATAYLVTLILSEDKNKDRIAKQISPKILALGMDAVQALDWVIAQPDLHDRRLASEWLDEILLLSGSDSGARLAETKALLAQDFIDTTDIAALADYAYDGQPDKESKMLLVEQLRKSAYEFYLGDPRARPGWPDNEKRLEMYVDALRVVAMLLEWKREPELLQAAFYYPAYEVLIKTKEYKALQVSDLVSKMYERINWIMFLAAKGDIYPDQRSLPDYINFNLKMVEIPGRAAGNTDSWYFLAAQAATKFISDAEKKILIEKGPVKGDEAWFKELSDVYVTAADCLLFDDIASSLLSRLYRVYSPEKFGEILVDKIAEVGTTEHLEKANELMSPPIIRGRPRLDLRNKLLSRLSRDVDRQVRYRMEKSQLPGHMSLKERLQLKLEQAGIHVDVEFRVKSDATVVEKVEFVENRYDTVASLSDLTGLIVIVHGDQSKLGEAITIIQNWVASEQGLSVRKDSSVDFKKGESEAHIDLRWNLYPEKNRPVALELIALTAGRYKDYRAGKDITLDPRTRITPHAIYRLERRSNIFKSKKAAVRLRHLDLMAPHEVSRGDDPYSYRSKNLQNAQTSNADRHYMPVLLTERKAKNPKVTFRITMETSKDASIADLLILLDARPEDVFFSDDWRSMAQRHTDLTRPLAALPKGVALYVVKRDMKRSLGMWLPKQRGFTEHHLQMAVTAFRYRETMNKATAGRKEPRRTQSRNRTEFIKMPISVQKKVMNEEGIFVDGVSQTGLLGDFLEDLKKFALDKGFDGYEELFAAVDSGFVYGDGSEDVDKMRSLFLTEFVGYLNSNGQELPSLKKNASGARLAQSTKKDLEDTVLEIKKELSLIEVPFVTSITDKMVREYETLHEKVKKLSDDETLRLSSYEKESVLRAFRLAFVAHQFFPLEYENRFRRIGGLNLPYIRHPVLVAEILIKKFAGIVDGSDSQVNAVAVMAALLHDVMEDTVLKKISGEGLMRLLHADDQEYLVLHSIIRNLSKQPGSTKTAQLKRILNNLPAEADMTGNYATYYHQILIKLSDRLASTQQDLDEMSARPDALDKKTGRQILDYLDSKRHFTKHFANFIYRMDYSPLRSASLAWNEAFHDIERQQIERISEKPFGAELLKRYPKRLRATKVALIGKNKSGWVWQSTGYGGKQRHLVVDVAVLSPEERKSFYEEHMDRYFEQMRAAYPPLWERDWLKDKEHLWKRAFEGDKRVHLIASLHRMRNGKYRIEGGYIYHPSYRNLEAIMGPTNVLLEDFRERFGDRVSAANLASLNLSLGASDSGGERGYYQASLDRVSQALETALGVGPTERLDSGADGARLAESVMSLSGLDYANGTVAAQFLKTLKLENAVVLEAQSWTAAQIRKKLGRRFHFRSLSSFTIEVSKDTALARQFGPGHTRFQLLFNEQGHLLAIFPDPREGEGTAKDKIFMLDAYDFPVDWFRNIHDKKIKKKIAERARKILLDRRDLKIFAGMMDYGVLPEKHPPEYLFVKVTDEVPSITQVSLEDLARLDKELRPTIYDPLYALASYYPAEHGVFFPQGTSPESSRSSTAAFYHRMHREFHPGHYGGTDTTEVLAAGSLAALALVWNKIQTNARPHQPIALHAFLENEWDAAAARVLMDILNQKSGTVLGPADWNVPDFKKYHFIAANINYAGKYKADLPERLITGGKLVLEGGDVSGARLAGVVERSIRDRSQLYKLLSEWTEGNFVSIYGSARIPGTHYYNLEAIKLGELMWKHGLVPRTGAGPSVMEWALYGYIQARDKDLAEKGLPLLPKYKTQGVGIYVPWEQEINDKVERGMRIEDFFVRKTGLHLNVKGTIAMPGGIGTLDELFETWRRGGTVVLVGTGFWTPLVDTFYASWERAGLLSRAPPRASLLITDDLEQAVLHIKEQAKRLPPYKVTEAEIAEINREVSEGMTRVAAMDPVVTFIGSPRVGPETKVATELASRLMQKNVPVRIGSRGHPLNAIVKRAKKEGWLDRLQAVLFVRKSDRLTRNEIALNSRALYIKDESNHQLVVTGNSRGYVFLPGGKVTMNLLWDIVTVIQTKKITPRPIVLIGRDFWKPIMDEVRNTMLVQEGEHPGWWDEEKGVLKVSTINPGNPYDIVTIVDTVDEAMEVLEKAVAVNVTAEDVEKVSGLYKNTFPLRDAPQNPVKLLDIVEKVEDESLRLVVFQDELSRKQDLFVLKYLEDDNYQVVARAAVDIQRSTISLPSVYALIKEKGYMRKGIKMLLSKGTYTEWVSGPIAAMSKDAKDMYLGFKKDGLRVTEEDGHFVVRLAGARLAQTAPAVLPEGIFSYADEKDYAVKRFLRTLSLEKTEVTAKMEWSAEDARALLPDSKYGHRALSYFKVKLPENAVVSFEKGLKPGPQLLAQGLDVSYKEFFLVLNDAGELIAIMPAYPEGSKVIHDVFFLSPFNVSLSSFKDFGGEQARARWQKQSLQERKDYGDVMNFMRLMKMKPGWSYQKPYAFVAFDPNGVKKPGSAAYNAADLADLALPMAGVESILFPLFPTGYHSGHKVGLEFNYYEDVYNQLLLTQFKRPRELVVNDAAGHGIEAYIQNLAQRKLSREKGILFDQVALEVSPLSAAGAETFLNDIMGLGVKVLVSDSLAVLKGRVIGFYSANGPAFPRAGYEAKAPEQISDLHDEYGAKGFAEDRARWLPKLFDENSRGVLWPGEPNLERPFEALLKASGLNVKNLNNKSGLVDVYLLSVGQKTPVEGTLLIDNSGERPSHALDRAWPLTGSIRERVAEPNILSADASTLIVQWPHGPNARKTMAGYRIKQGNWIEARMTRAADGDVHVVITESDKPDREALVMIVDNLLAWLKGRGFKTVHLQTSPEKIESWVMLSVIGHRAADREVYQVSDEGAVINLQNLDFKTHGARLAEARATFQALEDAVSTGVILMADGKRVPAAAVRRFEMFFTSTVMRIVSVDSDFGAALADFKVRVMRGYDKSSGRAAADHEVTVTYDADIKEPKIPDSNLEANSVTSLAAVRPDRIGFATPQGRELRQSLKPLMETFAKDELILRTLQPFDLTIRDKGFASPSEAGGVLLALAELRKRGFLMEQVDEASSLLALIQNDYLYRRYHTSLSVSNNPFGMKLKVLREKLLSNYKEERLYGGVRIQTVADSLFLLERGKVPSYADYLEVKEISGKLAAGILSQKGLFQKTNSDVTDGLVNIFKEMDRSIGISGSGARLAETSAMDKLVVRLPGGIEINGITGTNKALAMHDLWHVTYGILTGSSEVLRDETDRLMGRPRVQSQERQERHSWEERVVARWESIAAGKEAFDSPMVQIVLRKSGLSREVFERGLTLYPELYEDWRSGKGVILEQPSAFVSNGARMASLALGSVQAEDGRRFDFSLMDIGPLFAIEVRSGEELAGFIDVVNDGKATFIINHRILIREGFESPAAFMVKPEMSEAYRGIGQYLMTLALEESLKRGAKEFVVLTAFHESQDFYKKFGFKRIGRGNDFRMRLSAASAWPRPSITLKSGSPDDARMADVAVNDASQPTLSMWLNGLFPDERIRVIDIGSGINDDAVASTEFLDRFTVAAGVAEKIDEKSVFDDVRLQMLLRDKQPDHATVLTRVSDLLKERADAGRFNLLILESPWVAEPFDAGLAKTINHFASPDAKIVVRFALNRVDPFIATLEQNGFALTGEYATPRDYPKNFSATDRLYVFERSSGARLAVDDAFLGAAEKVYDGALDESADRYEFPGFKEFQARVTVDADGRRVGLFEPTPVRDAARLLKAAGLKEGMKFFDAGGGDGRVAAVAAEFGAEATSIEADPVLSGYGEERLAEMRKATQMKGDVHLVNDYVEHIDLSNADVVYYTLNEKMPDDVDEEHPVLSQDSNFRKMERQLVEQLKPGAVVIVTYSAPIYNFEDPSLEPFTPEVESLKRQELLRPKFYRKIAGARLSVSDAEQKVVSSQVSGVREEPSEVNIRFAEFYGARLAANFIATPTGQVVVFPYLEPMGIAFKSPVDIDLLRQGARLTSFMETEESGAVIQTLASQEIAEQIGRETRQSGIFDDALEKLGISSNTLEGVLGIELKNFSPEGLKALDLALEKFISQYPQVELYFMGSKTEKLNGVSRDAWEEPKKNRIAITNPDDLVRIKDAGYALLDPAAGGETYPAGPALHLAAYLLGVQVKGDVQANEIPDGVIMEFGRLAGNPFSESRLGGRHIVGFAMGDRTPDMLATARTYMIRAVRFVEATLHEYITALQAVGQSA